VAGCCTIEGICYGPLFFFVPGCRTALPSLTVPPCSFFFFIFFTDNSFLLCRKRPPRVLPGWWANGSSSTPYLTYIELLYGGILWGSFFFLAFGRSVGKQPAFTQGASILASRDAAPFFFMFFRSGLWVHRLLTVEFFFFLRCHNHGDFFFLSDPLQIFLPFGLKRTKEPGMELRPSLLGAAPFSAVLACRPPEGFFTPPFFFVEVGPGFGPQTPRHVTL